MSSFLITVFVGLCTFLWYLRFRYVAKWWNRTPTLRDRGFDLAELDLPSGWRPGKDLNDSAGIEAVDLLHGRYALVISESRDNFDARLGLDTYAMDRRDSLTSTLCLLDVRGPERCKVAGFDAVQFEIQGVHEIDGNLVSAHDDSGPSGIPSSHHLGPTDCVPPPGLRHDPDRLSRTPRSRGSAALVSERSSHFSRAHDRISAGRCSAGSDKRVGSSD